MNIFSEKFIVRKIVKEFTKDAKENIQVNCFSQGIMNHTTKEMSVIIIVINPIPTSGIIGFGIYFAEKRELIIYDSNGDIISIHWNMIFKSAFKGKIRKQGIKEVKE